MKRKFVIITISYIIGLIWGLYFYKNIALIFCIIFVIICLIRKNTCILMIALTILISCFYNGNIKKKYDLKYKGLENIEVIGTIVEEQSTQEYSKQYVIKVISIDGDTSFKNTHLLINEKINKTDGSKVKYGDLVSIVGEFKLGKIKTNYKGYNYNEYLRSKKIYGILETQANNIKIYKNNNINLYSKNVHKFYNLIKQKIYLILPKDTANICVALILGDKSNLEKDVIENFSESSLSHILAISGMHMSYIILLFSFILKFCGKKNSKVIIIFIIVLFCNLVGNSESIVRASFMAIIHIIGNLVNRKSDSITNLSISALLILIINPYSIKSMSFILSFGGTLGIILFYKLIKNKIDYIKLLNKNAITKYVKESIVISLSANIIIIPIIAIYFNKISFIFIISNIFANILLSIIMPLIFIFLFLSFISVNIAKFLSFILNSFLYLLLYLSNISAKIKILNFIVCTPYKITIAFYYIVLILILIKNNIKCKYIIKKFLRAIITIYLLICVIVNFIKYIDTNMYIHFIDVGQGDSTLIITRSNKKILVDGGGNENGKDYIGKNILLPYLLDRRIKDLDYIMISHFDSDHCKGILYVMEKLNVKNVIISMQGKNSENYNNFCEIVRNKRINVIVVKSNMKIKIDKDTYFDILWPEKSLIKENILNNNSIVAKLVYKNFSMIFTGDIELLAEEEIAKKYNLKSTILKVAHHGSKNSSCEKFLEKVNPNIALIGVGEDNKFGHPSIEILNRLDKIRL
ncbi:MAG: DNA internalization-related competence protein ComEC/Rec2 [Clostridia bacterium]|nr:DNA internalization-related competence protein ComEC/Rec2 [Clostridia bacterium]